MLNSRRFSRLKEVALLGALVCSMLGAANASVQGNAAVQASREASQATLAAVQAQAGQARAQAGQAQAEAALAKAQATTAKTQAAQTKALQQYTASELRRVKLNSERLLKMNSVQARRVAAVIRDLEGHKDASGHPYRPLIDSQVFRTPAQQAALVKAGHSTVYFSFHNAYKTDPKTGKILPDSLAADVVDAAKLWSAERPFWLKLNSAALAHGSTTGIAWGLSTANRQRLALAVATREWSYKGPNGWDTAHVEPRGLTIAQAKRGVRPK